MKNTLLILLFPIFLTAQTERLPFIGTRSFNFSGGSCCNESITIYNDGTCDIKAYEAPEFGNTVTLNYSGKFTETMWVYENGEKSFGYKVSKTTIMSMNKNGKSEMGCKVENKPCIEPLKEP
jgi:hypothetical protein